MVEQIGRYRILSELGRGAMGVVYKAQDPTIGRLVAIKTIRLGELVLPEEREQLRSRLFREAQSAGGLSHPGIVTIYDIAEEGNLAYITMEFVEGQTLEKVIDQGTVQDPKTLIALAAQTAMALDYAHSKGIVHRDIKPGNIMVNTEGMVKITDFGIARIASSKFTHTGTVMGTPSYMSPEQVRGAVVDGRSDLFSLTVVVYEMLTGQKPFSGESITTVIFKIVSEEPIHPKDINPSVGGKLNAVVMRALAKDPVERYQRGRDLAEALQAAAEQTVNLAPIIRKTVSVFDATEASDPGAFTLPEARVEPAPLEERPISLPAVPEADKAVEREGAAPVPVSKETVEVAGKAAPGVVPTPGAPPAGGGIRRPAEAAAPKGAAAPPEPLTAPGQMGARADAEPEPSTGAARILPPLETRKAADANAPTVVVPPPEKVLPPLEPKKPPSEGKKPAPAGGQASSPAALPKTPAKEQPAAAPPEKPKVQQPAPRPVPVSEPAAKKRSWLLPVAAIALVAVGIAAWFVMNRQSLPEANPGSTVKSEAAPPSGSPAPANPGVAGAPASKAAIPPASKPAPSAEKTSDTAAPSAAASKAAAGAPVELAINIATDEPGVRAVIDGKDDTACTTPCSIPVRPGSHVVLLSKAGFSPERREVQVGKSPVDLQVTLRPILGTVMLTTNPPGATVSVDGKAISGETPTQFKLPIGQHQVTVTKDGVGSGTQTIDVSDDSLMQVRITIRAQ